MALQPAGRERDGAPGDDARGAQIPMNRDDCGYAHFLPRRSTVISVFDLQIILEGKI